MWGATEWKSVEQAKDVWAGGRVTQEAKGSLGGLKSFRSHCPLAGGGKDSRELLLPSGWEGQLPGALGPLQELAWGLRPWCPGLKTPSGISSLAPGGLEQTSRRFPRQDLSPFMCGLCAGA